MRYSKAGPEYLPTLKGLQELLAFFLKAAEMFFRKARPESFAVGFTGLRFRHGRYTSEWIVEAKPQVFHGRFNGLVRIFGLTIERVEDGQMLERLHQRPLD
jgi:hypothetical protein